MHLELKTAKNIGKLQASEADSPKKITPSPKLNNALRALELMQKQNFSHELSATSYKAKRKTSRGNQERDPIEMTTMNTGQQGRDISVIIPAYNVAEYIGEALQSVVHQSPPFKQIIIIDDGSTDETKDIISEFNDARIIYHFHENRGLGPSRNVGIELASTEFIYLMDADDLLQPGLTSAFFSALDEAPNLDAFIFSGIDFLHEEPQARQKSSQYYERNQVGVFENGSEFLLKALAGHSFPDPVWLYIFRRNILEKHPTLRFQDILYEDTLFTAPLLMRSEKLVVSNDKFYKRRVRLNSIMTSRPTTRNVVSYLKIASWWDNLANNCDRHARRAIKLRAHYFYGHAIRSARRAGMSLSQIKSLTQTHAEQFQRFTTADFIVSWLSKKLAAKLIALRAQLTFGQE